MFYEEIMIYIKFYFLFRWLEFLFYLGIKIILIIKMIKYYRYGVKVRNFWKEKNNYLFWIFLGESWI